MNKSVAKRIGAVGTAVGVSKYLIPLGTEAIRSRSVTPITNAFTNKDVLMAMGKDAIIGYAVGYGAGKVCDMTGLKRPVNAVLKKVKL